MIPRTGITVSKKELLGILLVFIVYVLTGGVVFMLLESPREEQLRRELTELRNEFQEKLGLLVENSNLSRSDMEKLVHRLAVAHSNSLVDEAGNDTHTNWSFDNSFFFAITVVTTIGYGHLAPSTTPGRLFCVVYATVGIPLTGILLATIGGHYSQHLVRKLQKARQSRNPRLSLIVAGSTFLIPWLLVFLVLPTVLFMFTEGWSFVEGFYYCFITLSTIGFGDYVAGNFKEKYIWLYKLVVLLWIIFGLGYLAMILNYISCAMRCKQVRKVERKLSTSFYHTQQRVGQRIEDVRHIFQDMQKHRTAKPRGRMLKRIQSFPAPELVKDQNHNNKLQRLLDLAQHVQEEMPPPPKRPRRHSLPLPEPPPHMLPSTQARGSLQMYPGPYSSKITLNGYQTSIPWIMTQYLETYNNQDLRHGGLLPSGSYHFHKSLIGDSCKLLKVSAVDIVQHPDTTNSDFQVSNPAIIDMEGLQATRV